MRSTFHGLEVSKRGLFAQQSALHTTSHNIANANTEGYSRQRANMKTTNAIPVPGFNQDLAPGQLGTGVQVDSLQRVREDFLDVQFRNENKRFGYWETRLDVAQKVEDIMNEPSDTGLQKVMDQMWQAWQDLSKDPTDASARSVVRERAIAVADTFAYMYSHLQEIQRDYDNVINIKVLEINSIAQQLASLNKQISDVVPHGYVPNDLYDQRDVLLDRLSKLTSVQVTTAEHGMLNVTIEGKELVTGRSAVTMAAVKNAETGFYDITLDGQEFIPVEGSLAATFEGRGAYRVDTVVVDGVETKVVSGTGFIPDLLRKLDTLAVNLTKEINKLHKTGLSILDIKNGTKQEIPFFVDADELAKDPATKADPTGAAKLKIHPDILKSLDAIAAAKPEAGGSSSVGNNENALAIAALKFIPMPAGTGTYDFPEATTFDNYYRYTIGSIGVYGQEAVRNHQNSETIVGMIENQRQSVSGVSIDDEMANIVKFQHAYNAAARMMTSIDEMLDKVINGMGRVGL